VDVPVGDPQDIIGREMRQIWQQMHLKPFDRNFRILEYGDCYRVAVKANDHALYLLPPSPQTKEERATEHTLKPLPSISKEASEFARQQPLKNIPFSNSTLSPPPQISKNALKLPGQQSLKQTSPGKSTFTPPDTTHAPPNLPFRAPNYHQLPLVESSADVHRDKIGRGKNKLVKSYKEEPIQNRLGKSYQEESIEIRKRPQKLSAQGGLQKLIDGEGFKQSRKIATLKNNIKVKDIEEE
jgi:hypothetical protein